jgi:hypothetical protein
LLFVIEIATRRVCFAGCTCNPDEDWMLQMGRNLTDSEDGFLKNKRYLLMDRDTKYSEAFRSMLKGADVEALRLPPKSPNLNAQIERFARTIKEECLERLILFGEESLRNAVTAFLAHYHTGRNHQGIRKALAKHFQGVCWQRCQVHLMRELLNKAAWQHRDDLARDLKAIYASQEREVCLEAAEAVAVKWEGQLPKMSRALREGVEDTLSVLAFPVEHQRRLRTTNMIERQMREFRKRTRKVSIFPNEGSALRLFGAMMLELNDQWLGEQKRYLNMDLC